MSTNGQIICPQCGEEVIKLRCKPEYLDIFEEAVCDNCGAQIGKDEIVTQIRDLAARLVHDGDRRPRKQRLHISRSEQWLG